MTALQGMDGDLADFWLMAVSYMLVCPLCVNTKTVLLHVTARCMYVLVTSGFWTLSFMTVCKGQTIILLI